MNDQSTVPSLKKLANELTMSLCQHYTERSLPTFNEHRIIRALVSRKLRATSTSVDDLLTVGLALYQHLKLPLPRTTATADRGPFVLVYGGGTATGRLAIQMLCRYV